MKIKLDATSWNYKQLKSFFGIQNKDQLIHTLLTIFKDKKVNKEWDDKDHIHIEKYLEAIDLNELFTKCNWGGFKWLPNKKYIKCLQNQLTNIF